MMLTTTAPTTATTSLGVPVTEAVIQPVTVNPVNQSPVNTTTLKTTQSSTGVHTMSSLLLLKNPL
ncbi:hypothetical protein FKM82_021726 [Ascaphus truei]